MFVSRIEYDKTVKATAETLPWDEIFNVEKYLKPYFLLVYTIDKYFWNISNNRSTNGLRKVFARSVNVFIWLIFFRGLTLLLWDDNYVHDVLGSHRNIPTITVLTMSWSLYTGLLMHNFINAHKQDVKELGWLAPFQVLQGSKSPAEHGLNPTMTQRFRKRIIKNMNMFWLVGTVRTLLASTIFGSVYMTDDGDQNLINLCWAVGLTIWAYFTSGIIYMTTAFYDSVCYYLRIRYEKVNNDIDLLVSSKDKMKQDKRNRFMTHILREHNHLCVRLDDYNQFWSKYVLYTYFILVPICIYTLYQAIFVSHPVVEILVLALVTFECAVIIIMMSFSGSFMSDEAHSPYMPLIRAMFQYYPPDIQLQIRILIQRTSGPAIAFYCADLFEISHESFYSICMALGQNFFLLVDFVQSQPVDVGGLNNATLITAMNQSYIEDQSTTLFSTTL